MVGLIVWKDKGGNQATVVAPTVLVHLFELTATTQVDFHRRLIMRRSEPFSPLGSASLQNQSTILGGHSSTKAVRLCSASVVGLEGPFGHMITILPSNETIRLNASLAGVKKRRGARSQRSLDRRALNLKLASYLYQSHVWPNRSFFLAFRSRSVEEVLLRPYP